MLGLVFCVSLMCHFVILIIHFSIFYIHNVQWIFFKKRKNNLRPGQVAQSVRASSRSQKDHGFHPPIRAHT